MTLSALQDLIQQQISSARQLSELLKREREALEGKDPDKITEVVTEKQALLSSLSQLEIQREQLLNQLDAGSTSEEYDAFISKHDLDGRLGALTSELRSVLDSCFQMNRVNGGIAELSYHYLTHSLAILRGGDGHNEATYGPQGKPETPDGGHRSLAKA